MQGPGGGAWDHGGDLGWRGFNDEARIKGEEWVGLHQSAWSAGIGRVQNMDRAEPEGCLEAK